jgi:DnaJ family protein C protein 8
MQAESELSDKAKREELDAVINEARSQVLKALNLPTSTTDSDPRLQDLDPPFQVRLRAQSKQLLIDEELWRRKWVSSFSCRYFIFNLESSRAIKLNLANEGLEARKKEEEVVQKKRKAEDDKLWEGEY